MRAVEGSDVTARMVSVARTKSDRPSTSHVIGSRLRRTLVRLLAGLGVIFCVGLAVVSSGCVGYPPPSPNHPLTAFPTIALDSEGNLIVAYQISEPGDNPVTYLQKLTPEGERLWGTEGIRLDKRQPLSWRDHGPNPSRTQVVANPDGITTIFWTLEDQVMAKQVDKKGHQVWKKQVGTLRHSHGEWQWVIASNGVDTVMVWKDAGGNVRCRAIDGEGNLLWTEPPGIGTAVDYQAVCDAHGNLWLVWLDSFTEHIYLQAIDRTGKNIWAEPKELQLVPQPQPDSEGQRVYKYGLWLVEDDAGRVLVAWRNNGDNSPSPLEIRSCTTDGEILVVDSEGARVYTIGGITIGLEDQRSQVTASDGAVYAGAVSLSGYSIIKKIDADGAEPWGPEGIRLDDWRGPISWTSTSPPLSTTRPTRHPYPSP